MKDFTWWVLTPVIGVIAIVLSVSALHDAWDVAHGDGTTGVYVVTKMECESGSRGGETCPPVGDFTTDAGVVLHDARLGNPGAGWVVGDTVQAVDLGQRGPTVVLLREDSSWKFSAVFLVIVVIVLGVWAYAVYRRMRDDDEQGTWWPHA